MTDDLEAVAGRSVERTLQPLPQRRLRPFDIAVGRETVVGHQPHTVGDHVGGDSLGAHRLQRIAMFAAVDGRPALLVSDEAAE